MEDAELLAALAALDRTFVTTDRIGPIEACTHCFEPSDLTTLGGPVDQIPEALFTRALSRWGGTVDANPRYWRRWTPRTLRALINGNLAMDEERLAQKFQEADWRNWPPHETAAVEAVLTAWLRYASEPGSVAPGADEFLQPMLSF